MPRYEVADGTAHKFWEITLEGSTYTIRFGRIGATGQTQVKRFGSPAEARRAHDKIVAEKLGKGYKLVDGAPPPAELPVVEDHVNEELEAAILARPDDLGAIAVYADWLQQRGDPRGELMNVGLAMKRHTDPKKFLELKQAIAPLEAVKPALLGDALAGWGDRLKVSWDLGFVRKVEIRSGNAGELLAALLDRPVGRLVREIVVAEDGAGAVGALTGRPRPSVRTLSIFDESADPTDASGLWAALPRLESVYLRGPFAPGRIEAPALRQLTIVRLMEWDGELVERSLPSLCELSIWASANLTPIAGRIADGAFSALQFLALVEPVRNPLLVAALAMIRGRRPSLRMRTGT